MILNKVGRNPTSPLVRISWPNVFETPTVSAQQIQQQIGRAIQSITNQLVDHVNQQVGHLEATVSQSTNLNDNGQHENRHARYCPVDITQNVSGFFLTSDKGFIPRPLNSAFLAGRRYLGCMR